MATLPEGVLMQRAASGLATVCVELLGQVYGARVVLLIGSGNNGGDALWAGAMLAGRGAQVFAVLASERVHSEGLGALRAAGGRVTTDVQVITGADLVLDGLVGIGGRGELRGRIGELAHLCASSTGVVVAVDIPSGVDADTGAVAVEAVVADVTVTFGCLKPGQLVLPGLTHVGELMLIDIGLELGGAYYSALDAWDVAELLPPVNLDTYKYVRGVVGIAAGSAKYPGAAVLCAGAALRSGGGMVAFLDRKDGVADQVQAAYPEIVTQTHRVQAWVAGPGFIGDAADLPTLEFILAMDAPVVLDAGALRLLAATDALRAMVNQRSAPTVLTPHDGEFTALAQAVNLDFSAGGRIAQTEQLAKAYGAIVVRKGAGTIISGGFIDRIGGPELAVAGSGDVLSGMIAAMLVDAVDDVAQRVAAAVFIHGLAGASTGNRPCIAGDLIDWLPDTIGELRELT